MFARSTPRTSFERALAATTKAATDGRCGAAKSARRRALRAAKRLAALAQGDEEALLKRVRAVKPGACRLEPVALRRRKR